MSFLCTLLPIGALCGEPKLPDDLSVYSGKSPFEEVSGYRLLDVPRVAFNIRLYAGSDGIDFLNELDAGTDIELRDGALISGLCRKDDCASANAAIAVGTDGMLIALCTYAKDEYHGGKPGEVHWVGPSFNKSIPYQPGQACPQESGRFIDRFAELKK